MRCKHNKIISALLVCIILAMLLCACEGSVAPSPSTVPSVPVETDPITQTVSNYSIKTQKIDRNGNSLGEFTIEIALTLYPSLPEQADASVKPFDNVVSLVKSTAANSEHNQFVQLPDRYKTLISGCMTQGSNEITSMTISCSPDMDYWMILVDNKTAYLGSISGNADLDTLLNYFTPFPNNK